MDLTPEQKDIGKENFRAVMGSSLLNRKFLKKCNELELTSGDGLGPYYFGYGDSVESPVKVAVLGTGDEGSVLIGAINPKYIDVVSIADIRPYNQHRAFHGDLYSATAKKVRPGLIKKYSDKYADEAAAKAAIKVYADYNDLLDQAEADGVEAVIIALPLHLHAPAAVAAMNKGLHVLTEKLMAHSVHECKEMARVAKAKSLHLATGHQRHYNILYDNAVKAISSGVLGELHYIRAQWHRGNLPGKDSWQQAMPEVVKPEDAQAGSLEKTQKSWQDKVDNATAKLPAAEEALKADPKNEDKAKRVAAYEETLKDVGALLAQKNAQIADAQIVDKLAEYDYEEKTFEDGYYRPAIEELIRWRLWSRTGGGLMAELGSHQLDAASIFISAMHEGKKQYPLSVAAAANRPVFPHDRDVDDHVYCLFEFAGEGYDPDDELGKRKKISVQYASINGNGFGGYGETVFGTKGTLLLNLEKDALLYKTHAVETKVKLVDTDPDPDKVVLDLEEGEDLASRGVATQAFAEEVSRGYTEELEHWAWCVRVNPNVEEGRPEIEEPRCKPKVAMADAVIALTTNMAAREGRRIDFNPLWFDPFSDETPEDVKPDVTRYDA